MRSMEVHKKILFALVLVFALVVVPLVCFGLFYPKFRVQSFQDTVTLNYKNSYQMASGNVCYGNVFDCHDVAVSQEGNVDTGKLGEYKITYQYTFQNKVYTKEQTVMVVDQEPPTLVINDEELIYCPNGKMPAYSYTATDNYDGDLTDKVTVQLEDDKVLFSVVDSSGNRTFLRKDATALDESKPEIVLNGDSVVYVPLNGTYEELGASASDFCDGDLTNQIEITGEVDVTQAGEYQLTYSIIDSSGNESSVQRTVYVYRNNDYTAPSGKSIYLTFDDGPGPYTEKLLDVLKKYNVKATFFVTDQGLTKNYDSVILRAYQEGHTIGLHSNSHSYSIYTNMKTYFDDLYAIQAKVKRITGYTSTIIRFPGGSSNTISSGYDRGSRIMSQLALAVEAKGFRYFDWNISSGDAGETTDTNQIVKNVTSKLGSSSTYMVLQHDIKSYSVDAVEGIIQYGLANGYVFRPITMDTPTVHHHINN